MEHNKIAEMRARAGMTQKQLADELYTVEDSGVEFGIIPACAGNTCDRLLCQS